MKLFLFIIVSMMATHYSLNAQKTIKGFVKNSKNGKALSGVNISIIDSYDGATTDENGKFEFTTDEKGKIVFEAAKTDFISIKRTINIDTLNTELVFSLKEEITELQAVTISAGSFEASDKKKTTVLDPIDVVTTASANADITGALKTLPGTQQVNETEGLFVRGGTAQESKIFIDGCLVNNFFLSSTPGVATRGRFNPFLFKGTIFSAGGYSALYGQALSSALILESTDIGFQTEADFGASAVGFGGGFQKLAKNKNLSYGLSYGYTNLKLAFSLFPQFQNYTHIPTFHTIDFNFRKKIKGGGIVKFYTYFNASKVGFNTPSIDSVGLKDGFSVTNYNNYNNFYIRQPLKDRWTLQAGLSYSYNNDFINNSLQNTNSIKVSILNLSSPLFFKNFNLSTYQHYAQARFVLEKKYKGLNALRFGAEHFYSNEKANFASTNSGYHFIKNSTIIKDNLTATFGETDFYATNDLAVKIGARAEYSSLINRFNLAPRLSVAYKLKDKSQLSFAHGVFYQKPDTRNLPTTIQDIAYANATHYILQYQKIANGTTLRAETFYKKYGKLYLFDNNNRVKSADGYGYATGFELFWRDKKNIKNLDYWISYSYLNTKRLAANFPVYMQPNFAAPHVVNLVAKKFVMPWKTGFNASYTYSTGRPFYDIAWNNTNNRFDLRSQGKSPDYNNLSISVNYLPNIGKKNTKNFAVWVLSVNNVFGFNQVFNKQFSYDGLRSANITAPARRFVFFGCFLSFGADRTEDIINNNL